MYIRTTCGVLGILKHIKLNMYEFNNERYIKNGTRLHNSNHDYTIKTQKEELRDVLEDTDNIYYETPNKYDDKIILFIHIKLYSYHMNYFEFMLNCRKVKIVTHEQCEPLKQEVL